MSTFTSIVLGIPWISAFPALVLQPPQDRPESVEDVLFLLGAAAIAVIVLGYFLIRRWRQYPVDSPFSPETRGGHPSGDDEEEVETIL